RHVDLARQTLVAVVVALVVGAADLKIVEGRVELIEETILEDVHLVEVVLTPQVRAASPHEANLKCSVPADLALESEREGLRVAGLEVRVEIVGPAGAARRRGERVFARVGWRGQRRESVGAGRDVRTAGGAKPARAAIKGHGTGGED